MVRTIGKRKRRVKGIGMVMELKAGMSAMVTGGGAGIGKAVSKALGERGVAVTVVDLKGGCEEVVGGSFFRCDVTNSQELSAAFEYHVSTHGGLDICVNSAGVTTAVPMEVSDEVWRRTLDINLTAAINSTLLAIRVMKAGGRGGGVIINMGSSAGLYPAYQDPVYAASKGGLVLFTRSLGFYKRQGIRVNVLCPEYIQTDIGSQADHRILALAGGFIPMDLVVKGTLELITDHTKAGACLWVTNRRGLEYWPTPQEVAKYRLPSSAKSTPRTASTFTHALNPNLPHSFHKIVVQTLNHNFRSATKIVTAPLTLPIKRNHALVKILYAGVNASDVNFSSGRYFSGKDGDSAGNLPFDAGFEAVGLIAAVDDSINDLKVGNAVAVMTYGSYAEFMIVPHKYLLPVDRPDPEVVAMLTSGLTASIALEQAAQMGSGKTVLVTAAAGGTGQFAVQLAKLAGNKVVATCGGKDKAELLKRLGVDRVINYREEDVKTVLKKEFPKGVDIIYESVGGQMFDMCLNALSIFGRLVVIGMISQYQGEHGWKPANYPGLCEKLLAKSQAVAGFFLVQYSHLWRQHLAKLYGLYSSGKLKVIVDPKTFVGLQSVPDAVEYLHSGRSVGKVVVCMDPSFSQAVSKL